MKCIKAIKASKKAEVGTILRVDDVEAEARVKSTYWTYISKAEWKATQPKEEPKVEPVEEKIIELTDTIVSLDEEVTKLKDIIATKRWDATDIEQQDAHETILELREKIKMLELENKSLRDSRDMYQHRNAELIRKVKSLQKKK